MNLDFQFGIPAATNGQDGQSAYDAWIAYAEEQDPPIEQPTGTITDMFDWLAAQAVGDITATAEITQLAAGSDPTVTVTIT